MTNVLMCDSYETSDTCIKATQAVQSESSIDAASCIFIYIIVVPKIILMLVEDEKLVEMV